MRAGIFGRTFPGTDPEAVLDRVAQSGFASVHWNWASAGLSTLPETIPNDLPEHVANAARARGVAIAGVSATANLIHPDPLRREAALRAVGAVIASAPALGAPLVTLCSGTRDPDDPWRAHPGNADPEAWRDLLNALHVLIPLADAAGVALGIEPETSNVVSDPAKARRLLDELRSPALAIVLDPANLFEEPPHPQGLRDLVAQAVDLLGPDLAMAHAKDRDGRGSVAAAGQGIIDFPHFADLLRRAGFDGDVVTHGLTPEEAPAVADLLKRTFA